MTTAEESISKARRILQADVIPIPQATDPRKLHQILQAHRILPAARRTG